MQKAVFLPQLELTMESAAVVRWLVQVGDRVQAEQPILEVETEKAVAEVACSDSGYVRRQCVKVGDTIGAKALLCILTDTADEAIEDGAELRMPSDKSAADAIAVHKRVSPEAKCASPDPTATAVRAAPAARKLAQELGIDLRQVNGTGPDGRITVGDVQIASSKKSDKSF